MVRNQAPPTHTTTTSVAIVYRRRVASSRGDELADPVAVGAPDRGARAQI